VTQWWAAGFNLGAQLLELLEDDSVGESRSHGCIRMRNADVIALFDRVDIGTLVRIDE
jgi:hypothetical protein